MDNKIDIEFYIRAIKEKMNMTSSHALKGCPDGQLFASQKAGFPDN